MWDKRFQDAPDFYGQQPCSYLQQVLPLVPKPDGQAARALFIAEGQGRNALYAASLGWQVTATDTSAVAREQTLNKASALGLEINYQLIDTDQLDYKPQSFDLVVLIYAHTPRVISKTLHQKLIQWLSPDGQLILEGFSKDQDKYNSGGPPNADWRYSLQELLVDFQELTILDALEGITWLEEGAGHDGLGAVVRFRARRK